MPATVAFVIRIQHQKPTACYSLYSVGTDGSAIHTFKAPPIADAMILYGSHGYALISHSLLLFDYLTAFRRGSIVRSTMSVAASAAKAGAMNQGSIAVSSRENV
jgi:hypothetical protein